MESASLNKLGEDLQTLIADTEELLRATAAHPGEKISAARDRAEQSLRGVRDHLGAAQEAIKDRASSANDYVRENPWSAIAAASAVAFVLGLVVSKR